MPEANAAPITFKSLEDSLARNAADAGLENGNEKNSQSSQQSTTHLQKSLGKQELIVFPWAHGFFSLSC